MQQQRQQQQQQRCSSSRRASEFLRSNPRHAPLLEALRQLLCLLLSSALVRLELLFGELAELIRRQRVGELLHQSRSDLLHPCVPEDLTGWAGLEFWAGRWRALDGAVRLGFVRRRRVELKRSRAEVFVELGPTALDVTARRLENARRLATLSKPLLERPVSGHDDGLCVREAGHRRVHKVGHLRRRHGAWEDGPSLERCDGSRLKRGPRSAISQGCMQDIFLLETNSSHTHATFREYASGFRSHAVSPTRSRQCTAVRCFAHERSQPRLPSPMGALAWPPALCDRARPDSTLRPYVLPPFT